MSKGLGVSSLLFTLVVVLSGPAGAAEFAPAGSQATLTVDYLYESAGSKSSEGMYDPYQWRAKHSVNLVATLAAQAGTALPALQAMSASQSADLNKTAARAQAMSTDMASMAADAQKIIDKCGDNEDCITREAQKMGQAMQGTPQMAAATNAKKQADGLKPGAPRYQAFFASAQKGTYAIDETVHISVTDPICTGRPRHRCTRDEVRKGAGMVTLPAESKKKTASPGIGAVEVDTVKNTLTVRLPVPVMIPYTETITTDEPEGTHDTPTPKGPQQKMLRFRVNAKGDVMNAQPFTVPLKGGWRTQSGEQVVMLKGDFAEGGKLTVRWRFEAH